MDEYGTIMTAYMHELTRREESPDLLPEFSALFRLLGMGQDGLIDGTRRLIALVAKLPAYEADYLYPWYCLLAALSTDFRRHLFGESSVFEWDVTRRLDDALGRATYTQYLFEQKKTPTLLSPAVIAFSQRARAEFVLRCWRVIDPQKSYAVAREASLADLLDAVSANDRNRRHCLSVLLDLEASPATSSREWADILAGIYGIELDSDVRL